MTATMTAPADPREAFAAARARLEGRRNVYEPHTVAEERKAWAEGRTLAPSDIGAPEFRPAESLGEWLDDLVLARRGVAGFPETPVLVGILEGMREGAAGAAKAVRAARHLDRAVQVTAFRNIQGWRRDAAGRFGADALVNEVERAWSKARLAETPDGG